MRKLSKFLLTVILTSLTFFIFSLDSLESEVFLASNNKEINPVGSATISTGFIFQGMEFGGISGITYNPEQQLYYGISDDRGNKAPARFYTLKIKPKLGSNEKEKRAQPTQQIIANNLDIEMINVTKLLDKNGRQFPEFSTDTEGIAFNNNSVFISSEGDVSRGIDPFIKEFDLTGKEIKSIPIPEKFRPNNPQTQGVRNNLSLENLSITSDGKYLFTANENALFQDGEIAGINNNSPCRLLRYNLLTGEAPSEFLYLTETIPSLTNNISSKIDTNGLVDLIALDDQHLLSLERGLNVVTGSRIRIFEISLSAASNINQIPSLKDVNPNSIKPITKKLLLDLPAFNISPDNIEGMTLGPVLSDGRRLLVLVSDNNFSNLQITQILAFGLRL